VYKNSPKWFSEFDVVYGDEAHQFKAKSLTTIMNRCINTKFRIGTTGTLDGTKVNKLVLEGIFGPTYKVTKTKDLMDKGQLAELKVIALVLNHPEESKKIVSKYSYQEEIEYLVLNEKRNKLISQLALAQTGNTLVLFQFVEKHGKVLYNQIKQLSKENRKIFFVSGDTKTEDREAIRRITEKEQDAIIVASYGTFSTGINIRNLHNIVFSSPSKSRIRTLQSIGRGLRKGDAKVSCNLFDIGDDLSWKSKKNYTLLHMIERIKIYNEEEFKYKLDKIDL
jgi:superfamily II DNA or RNA helicase